MSEQRCPYCGKRPIRCCCVSVSTTESEAGMTEPAKHCPVSHIHQPGMECPMCNDAAHECEPTNPCPNCTGKPWSWKDGVEWHTGEVCPVCNGSQKVPVTQPELTDAFRAAVADEAEMLAFIQLLKESLKADIRREMDAAIAEDAEFDCAVNVPRDQLRALQLLLSRYQSQQERIKELEDSWSMLVELNEDACRERDALQARVTELESACSDLDEARIALFNEREALAAQLETWRELANTRGISVCELTNENAELLAKVERLTVERDGWKRTAFQLGGVVQENTSLKASQEPPQNDFDYNSPPFQSAGKRMVSAAVEPMSDDLAMLVRRLSRQVLNRNPDAAHVIALQAQEYLERKGLTGSILRDSEVAARLAAEGGDQLAETKPSTTTKANQDK